MKITELINDLNEFCQENKVYYLEDKRLNDLWHSYNPHYIQTLDWEEYRWFIIENEIYSFNFNDEIVYIGVWGVESIKSEQMDLEDCDMPLQFVEMEIYPTFSYRAKEY